MTDLIEPVGPHEEKAVESGLSTKLAWFAGLALASLAVVAVTAYILRGFLLMG